MSETYTIERIYHPSIDQMNAMNATKDKGVNQTIMAGLYADCMRCEVIYGRGSIDWRAINEAITKRWPNGLNRIKEKAWKELKCS